MTAAVSPRSFPQSSRGLFEVRTVDARSYRYKRTRLFVLTLGYSRKSVRLLVWKSSIQTWAEHERARAHHAPLAVSRRTDVVSSIRLSDQPRRPSARTCCFFSSLKTLLIPAQEHDSCTFVNASGAYAWSPVLSCFSVAGFGCPPGIRYRRAHADPLSPLRLLRGGRGHLDPRTRRPPHAS